MSEKINLNDDRRVYTIAVRKSDTQDFKDFFKEQSNVSEAIRFLIYSYIKKNGVTNITTNIDRSY